MSWSSDFSLFFWISKSADISAFFTRERATFLCLSAAVYLPALADDPTLAKEKVSNGDVKSP